MEARRESISLTERGFSVAIETRGSLSGTVSCLADVNPKNALTSRGILGIHEMLSSDILG